MSVRVSAHFGIVVQKAAINRSGVTRQALLDLMETSRPLDEDEALLSFGPHFGGEAADAFRQRLEALGLSYPSDFHLFEAMVPEWCELSCSRAGAEG